VAEAERAEFDLDKAVWIIPAARVKNGRQHVVPLSPLAVKLVRAAIEAALAARFLFPSAPRSKTGRGEAQQPIGPHAMCVAMRRALEPRAARAVRSSSDSSRPAPHGGEPYGSHGHLGNDHCTGP
jgi:integrase